MTPYILIAAIISFGNGTAAIEAEFESEVACSQAADKLVLDMQKSVRLIVTSCVAKEGKE